MNVTPAGGTVSEGDTVLLISNSESGPFDKSCELRLSGEPESLKPLSTADLTSFYQATAQDHEGIAVRYRDSSGEVDQNVLHGTVYLQCRYAPCDVYFDRNELKLGTDAQALAAMRLGLKITTGSGSMTYLLKLDDMGDAAGAEAVRTVPGADTVVSSVNGDGQAVYTADPAQEIAGFLQWTERKTEATRPEANAFVLWKQTRWPLWNTGCIWRAVMITVRIRYRIEALHLHWPLPV